MLDVIGSIVFTAALFGMGYAVYRKGGVVGLWNRLKGTVHDMLNAFAPAVRGLMLGQYAAGGELPPRPVQPVIDAARLEQVAAVPLEEIIEAAEWHAEHPDEPLPQIIADLEPGTWRPAPRIGPILLAVDTSHFKDLVKAKDQGFATGGVVVLPNEGMTYVPRDACPAEIILTAKPAAKRPVLPNSYANCDHPDADYEELMGWSSTRPVRRIVKSCEMCEAIADVRGHHDTVEAMLGRMVVDGVECVLSGQEYEQHRQALRDAEAAKQRLQLLVDRRAAHDRLDKEMRHQVGG